MIPKDGCRFLSRSLWLHEDAPLTFAFAPFPASDSRSGSPDRRPDSVEFRRFDAEKPEEIRPPQASADRRQFRRRVEQRRRQLRLGPGAHRNRESQGRVAGIAREVASPGFGDVVKTPI